MTAFDLAGSLENAKRRLGSRLPSGTRRPRSDRGRSRLDPRVIEMITRELSGQDPPSMTAMLRHLVDACGRRGLTAPSRATVYKLMARLPTPTYRKGDLPVAVQEALYNFAPASRVPAHQVAFHCFNYGDLAAMSFAAGLPWLALYHALRLPGHRPRCRGLLVAVARARGL